MKFPATLVLLLGSTVFVNACAVFHPNGRHLSQWAIDKYWSGSADAPGGNAAQPAAVETREPAQPRHSPAAIPVVFFTGLIDTVIVNPIVAVPPSIRTASQTGHATGLVVAAPIITRPLAPIATILACVAVLPVAEVAYVSIPGLLPRKDE